jgi:hypothetical protein
MSERFRNLVNAARRMIGLDPDQAAALDANTGLNAGNPVASQSDLPTNPLDFKGEIAVAADFPTAAAVQVGWWYSITAPVTDNDGTKTNTGLSFVAGDEIYWSGSTWGTVGPLLTNKADKVTGAAAGNFSGLDGTGNLTDSGSKTADFATAAHKTQHQNGGGDELALDGSQITTGTVTTTRLSTGATVNDVCIGNDSRLADARTPVAHKVSHQNGGTDELALDGSQITSGTVTTTRLSTGATANDVCIGNDARLSDARTPTAHKVSHQNGGSDELGLDGSQITAGTVTTTRLSTGATANDVCIGNDARLSDTRDPNAHNHAGEDVTTGTVALARLPEGIENLDKWANGTILDYPAITVDVVAGVVYCNVEKSGGGDVRVQLGESTFTYTAGRVALSHGTDTVPVQNYSYIWDDGGVVTLANVVGNHDDVPGGIEHVPIGEFLVQSVASVNTDGALKVHAWTDDISHENGQSHLRFINERLRQENASWKEGVATTLAITVNGSSADNVLFSTTAGEVYQLHEHDFPVFAVGSDVYVVNQNGTPYDKVTDLNVLLTDALGSAIGNDRRFSLVIWGCVSEDTGDCKLYCNLPNGDYKKDNDAIQDKERLVVYDIPSEFKGTGFLIAELILKYETADSGTWTEVLTRDLRGLLPSISAGGGSVQGSEFSDADFKVFDDSDPTAELEFDASAISTGTTRTITMPDNDVDLGDISNILATDTSYPVAVGDSLQDAIDALPGLIPQGVTASITLDGTLNDPVVHTISGALFENFNPEGQIVVQGEDGTASQSAVLGVTGAGNDFITVLKTDLPTLSATEFEGGYITVLYDSTAAKTGQVRVCDTGGISETAVGGGAGTGYWKIPVSVNWTDNPTTAGKVVLNGCIMRPASGEAFQMDWSTNVTKKGILINKSSSRGLKINRSSLITENCTIAGADVPAGIDTTYSSLVTTIGYTQHVCGIPGDALFLLSNSDYENFQPTVFSYWSKCASFMISDLYGTPGGASFRLRRMEFAYNTNGGTMAAGSHGYVDNSVFSGTAGNRTIALTNLSIVRQASNTNLVTTTASGALVI